MKAFDIETIPNEAMIDMLPEPEVALGNTKNPAIIKEKVDEAKKKQLERMNRNPMTGRICSFAVFGDDENERYFRVVKDVSEAEEISLLNDLLLLFKIGTSEIANIIVTWNGMEFDFPFIYKRSALLRVAIPNNVPGLRYWTKKYTSIPHCDLKQEWLGWKQSSKSSKNDIEVTAKLDYMGKVFLGSGKTERDYLTYLDLIKNGEGEKIGLDNLCDTKITYDLYKVLEPYLF